MKRNDILTIIFYILILLVLDFTVLAEVTIVTLLFRLILERTSKND